MTMLTISNLHARVAGKDILKGLSLDVKPGEVHAIMGPNGAGKSTLGNILSGRDGYEVGQGTVSFEGRDLLALEPEERAAAGVFLAFQYPVEIPGVNNTYFLRSALNAQRKARGESELDSMQFLKLVREKLAVLHLKDELLHRGVNEGFSGGEKKRNEIFQLAVLEPKLAILDETDSGLDIDALKAVADGVNALLRPRARFDPERARMFPASLCCAPGGKPCLEMPGATPHHPCPDRCRRARADTGEGLERDPRRRVARADHAVQHPGLPLLRGGQELPQEQGPQLDRGPHRHRPRRAGAHGRPCQPHQRAADLRRRCPRRWLRRHDGPAPRRQVRAAAVRGRRMSGPQEEKDRVAEFTAFRKRMNERILAEPNQVVRRFFALDTQTYQPGALDVKTKELLGLVASMVLRCDDCISYHVAQCKEAGVTRDEMFETFSVGLVVGGSIVIPHLRRAVDFLDRLEQGEAGAVPAHDHG